MPPSAAEILERTARVYASCSSYRDTGEFVTVVSGGAPTNKPRSHRQPFSTLFVRPDLLRYEASNANEGPSSTWHRHVVWAAGGRAQGWFSADPPAYSPTSIHAALAATGGSGWRIPSMLLRRDTGDALPMPQTAWVREDVTPEGIEAYVVGGTTGKGLQLEVWFDATAFLILRTRHERTLTGFTVKNRGEGARNVIRSHPRLSEDQRNRLLGDLETALDKAEKRSRGFHVETTTTYVPEVNVDIPADAFDFTPPA